MNNIIMTLIIEELDRIANNLQLIKVNHYFYSDKNSEIEFKTDSMQFFAYMQEKLYAILAKNITLADGLKMEFDTGENWQGITIYINNFGTTISLFCET